MRNCPVNPMRSWEPCGAKTRKGHPCRTPGMTNGRCRMHGGTNPGAPKGNRNAWKHGMRSAEYLEMRSLLRSMTALLRVS